MSFFGRVFDQQGSGRHTVEVILAARSSGFPSWAMFTDAQCRVLMFLPTVYVSDFQLLYTGPTTVYSIAVKMRQRQPRRLPRNDFSLGMDLINVYRRSSA